MNEGENVIRSIRQEIRALEREIVVLNVAIEEGDCVREALGGQFWGLVRRTLQALSESYKAEAYEAVRTPAQSPNYFLGRMSNNDDIVSIVENNFIQGAERALERRNFLQSRIDELKEILDKGENPGYTGGNGEMS